MFDKKSLAKGKVGEEAVLQWLLYNGYNVVDVRDDWEYRKKDIDFLASKGDNIITIEVKSQTRLAYSNLMCIEDILNINTALQGWIHKCKAEFLIFYSHGSIWIVKTEEMRQYVLENLDLKYDFIDDPIINDSTALVKYVNITLYRRTGNYFRYVSDITE